MEDNKLSTAGKKKTKELKVLDAKAAQNLSVVLGMRTSFYFLSLFYCKKLVALALIVYGVKYICKAHRTHFIVAIEKNLAISPIKRFAT